VKYEIILVIFLSKTLTLVFPSLIPSDDFETVRRNVQQKEVLVSVNMSARLFSLLQTRGPAGAEHHFVDQNFCRFGKIVVLYAQAHIFVNICLGPG
jgi:hypothetical protein